MTKVSLGIVIEVIGVPASVSVIAPRSFVKKYLSANLLTLHDISHVTLPSKIEFRRLEQHGLVYKPPVKCFAMEQQLCP